MRKVETATPGFADEVSLVTWEKVRTGRPTVTKDLLGPFHRQVGYLGYAKSLYTEDWFDSTPERDLASMLDDVNSGVTVWVRLQRGDLPLLWRGHDSWYNPDFLAVESDATWVVEVKGDDAFGTPGVQAKRQAAERWAARVSADHNVDRMWRYLLVSEMQVKNATGDWKRLRALYAGR